MDSLPTNRFDVIVVGAGPAGVTAAMALGRAGFSVLLCEAGIFPGAENWSGAVYFAENLERREAFGPDAVEAAPFERRVVERGAYLYDGHGLLGASLHGPDVFRSCYTVLRPVYDRYLAEVAREQGVLLSCETTVQSLIRHRGRVIGVHTERGPAYADVVFLAEGDASHLVTQEGYERVTEEEHGEGAPHFLQGVKEVVSLPPRAIEERLGLAAGEGGAYEMLLRNATRKGRTVRLNMGGFLYTNRDSVSLGFVLPLDNLKRHFQGDHELLMEWFKQLPEIARLIDGGELTSYGAKIIRGGGFREIPRLVDDGLAIGGAASGVGIDFPYPNFTGPATAMGLYFAQAVRAIAEEHGGPGRQGDPTRSPYTAKQLQRTYLRTLRSSHHWRNVEYLKDWPGYVERTRFFFEKQLDLFHDTAYLSSRTDRAAPARWWQTVRAVRRRIPARRWGETVREQLDLVRTIDGRRLVRAAITPGNVGRVLWNTLGALLPLGSDARIGASGELPDLEDTGVAEATAPDGSRLRAIYRVGAGEEDPGRPPLVFRWLWRRYGGALAAAFSEVYRNDDTDLGRKLEAAAVHVGGRFSVWDLVVKALGGLAFGLTAAIQVAVEWFQLRVLDRDLSEFRRQPANRLVEEKRERIRLDEEHVPVRTPYETKLGTITYREGTTSHIKVMWPEGIDERQSLADSSLWSVCPAKVYEVRRSSTGAPGVVVNFDNCIKCETCWRATDDVHWSRATQQRLIYETYTPTQTELHDYLLSRPEPRPRLRTGPGFWEAVPSAGDDRPESVGAAARE
ncbi:MAG: FAD-dependent oxidoreductase, partial [Acidobacteriota bacterium]